MNVVVLVNVGGTLSIGNQEDEGEKEDVEKYFQIIF